MILLNHCKDSNNSGKLCKYMKFFHFRCFNRCSLQNYDICFWCWWTNSQTSGFHFFYLQYIKAPVRNSVHTYKFCFQHSLECNFSLKCNKCLRNRPRRHFRRAFLHYLCIWVGGIGVWPELKRPLKKQRFTPEASPWRHGTVGIVFIGLFFRPIACAYETLSNSERPWR